MAAELLEARNSLGFENGRVGQPPQAELPPGGGPTETPSTTSAESWSPESFKKSYRPLKLRKRLHLAANLKARSRAEKRCGLAPPNLISMDDSILISTKEKRLRCP